jgi:hypothetical protein
MNSQDLALLIAELLEEHAEDGIDAATPDPESQIEVRRFTPSILPSRAFLGLIAPGNKQFLITVEEA